MDECHSESGHQGLVLEFDTTIQCPNPALLAMSVASLLPPLGLSLRGFSVVFLPLLRPAASSHFVPIHNIKVLGLTEILG